MKASTDVACTRSGGNEFLSLIVRSYSCIARNWFGVVHRLGHVFLYGQRKV